MPYMMDNDHVLGHGCVLLNHGVIHGVGKDAGEYDEIRLIAACDGLSMKSPHEVSARDRPFARKSWIAYHVDVAIRLPRHPHARAKQTVDQRTARFMKREYEHDVLYCWRSPLGGRQ